LLSALGFSPLFFIIPSQFSSKLYTHLALYWIAQISIHFLGGDFMKKFLLIGLIVALALILVGGVGVVFAQGRGVDNAASLTVTTSQNGDKIVQQFGYGPGGPQSGSGTIVVPGDQPNSGTIQVGPGGMMGRNEYGYGPGGMMGGNGRGGMMGGDGYGYGPGGMMGGNDYGYGPGGMMGGRGFGQEAGVMHNYMIAAFATAVGLTVDDVNSRLTNGETMAQIALAQGKTEADLPALWTQVRQDALNKAVADGVITQAQADLMLQHMNNYSGEGLGPGNGNCPMHDGDEAQP
jgi:hypothetical protein